MEIANIAQGGSKSALAGGSPAALNGPAKAGTKAPEIKPISKGSVFGAPKTGQSASPVKASLGSGSAISALSGNKPAYGIDLKA